ncbi:ectonucleotide pyrophosphatase/phosphodiesterase family member 5-like [Babylonia areolata]|uniref:ectonucleotide pyrophosphatase/phosphodiesterase family member 5-like n=1 Tax=Babylonia areolata TaxID=304850 RepID=UPI003FCF3BFF
MSAFISVLSSVLILSLTVSATAGGSLPKLLLITFDGFGWNFLNKLPASDLPGFQAFMEKGVHVRWIENVFPSVTRTNHMSLVSGLYSESHGIVENDFFDHTLQAAMPKPGELKEEDSQWVDVGAEPVWVTNSQAGNGRRSGTIFWPCADAKIKGRMPDEIRRGEWKVTEQEVSATDRIDLALDWLTGKSVQPVNFVAVYTEDPDETSHLWGPDSEQVLGAIRSRDEILQHLLSEMKKKNLEDEVNVIITADHGQLPVYPEAAINMDLLIDPSWYTAYPPVNITTMSNLWPNEGRYQEVVEGLKGKHRSLHVATSSDGEDLVKMHYSSSPRIASIVVFAEPGWVMVGNDSQLSLKRGQHGWDPRFSANMWPFFMAKGPAFRSGVRDAEPFHMVDVYPLMCHILGLTPAPNNGSLGRAAHILSSLTQSGRGPGGNSHDGPVNYTWVAIGLLVIILGFVIAVIVIRYVRNTKNVSASYKRTFARAGSTEDMMDGMVVISDEEL